MSGGERGGAGGKARISRQPLRTPLGTAARNIWPSLVYTSASTVGFCGGGAAEVKRGVRGAAAFAAPAQRGPGREINARRANQ